MDESQLGFLLSFLAVLSMATNVLFVVCANVRGELLLKVLTRCARLPKILWSRCVVILCSGPSSGVDSDAQGCSMNRWFYCRPHCQLGSICAVILVPPAFPSLDARSLQGWATRIAGSDERALKGAIAMLTCAFVLYAEVETYTALLASMVPLMCSATLLYTVSSSAITKVRRRIMCPIFPSWRRTV